MPSKSQQIIELTESNEMLENYFSNTVIPQIIVDEQMLLIKFNLPAMQKFGLKKEFIGLPVEEIKHSIGNMAIIEVIKSSYNSGRVLEQEIQTSDLRWYQLNLVPFFEFAERKLNGIIVTFIDVTQRILSRQRQQKLIAEHELLLDTVAHDIKNPLLALGFTIQTLKRSVEKNMGKLSVLIENIESSMLQINRVVHDLAELRWQENYSSLNEEVIDLGSLLDDTKRSLAYQINESGAVIKEEIGIVQLYFVRRKLFSVIYNLLSNAVNYVPSHRIPEIFIKIYEENDEIVIAVKDNGRGINQEDLKNIFAKFHRIGDSVNGSGVGLYLVNTIVKEAGGRIELNSEPDKGSVFKIFLKKQADKEDKKLNFIQNNS